MNALDELRTACSAPLPHPGAEEMEGLAHVVMSWVLRHHLTLPDQSVGHSATRPEMEALLRHQLSADGRSFAEVFSDFTSKVLAHTFHAQHPRFLAFVPTGASFYSFLGEVLCAGTNLFAGVWVEAAGPAQVEILVLDWFKQWLGYPETASGVLTSGGSEANLTALVAARETLPMEKRTHAILYVGEQRHWSIDRAARIIGLRPEQIRPVGVDSDFRMMPALLDELVQADRAAGLHPWAVVAVAGATNTGAVDPLEAVSGVCQREGLWLHVDAAYGWTAVLTEPGKHLLRGIERADSLTLDPHKWLAQTYEAGCVLVREGKRLSEAFALRPEYMQDVEPDVDEVNFCDHGIALSRRFRALKIWLSLQVLGLDWYRRLIEHCCRLAELSQRLLEVAGCFEMMSPARLSIICFRHRPANVVDEVQLDLWNRQLVEELRDTGRVFLSSTRLNGRVALRFCFVNWRTTTADVEEAVRLLAELGQGRRAVIHKPSDFI